MLDVAKNYELLVRPLGRTAADEYYHQGNLWIEGRDGNSFVIEACNHTNSPAVFIISVDGHCIRDGQPAGPNSPGFIVAPKSNYLISSWQLEHGRNEPLIFARKSAGIQAGVIGALVYSVGYNNSVAHSLVYNPASMPAPANTSPTMLAVYYNSLKNLQKMGILVKTRRNVNYTANAFPLYEQK